MKTLPAQHLLPRLAKAGAYFRKPTCWLLLILCIMSGFIAYQQQQIAELQAKVESFNDLDNKNGFNWRVTNLEYIINAHTATLHEHTDDLRILLQRNHDVTWRVTKLEWQLPGSGEDINRAKTDLQVKFDNNPGRVPPPSRIFEPYQYISPFLKP